MLEENNKMVNEITTLVNEVKSKLSKEINNSIIYACWNIGRIKKNIGLDTDDVVEYCKSKILYKNCNIYAWKKLVL